MKEKLDFMISFYKEVFISKTFVFINNEKDEKKIKEYLHGQLFYVVNFHDNLNIKSIPLNSILLVNTTKFPYFLFANYHFGQKCFLVHMNIPLSKYEFLQRNGTFIHSNYSNYMNILLCTQKNSR